VNKIFGDPIERLLYLSLVVLFIAGGLGIYIVSLQLQTIDSLSKDIQTQALATRNHTDCVALLLTQPNHQQLRIQNLQDCKIGPN
jgi:hypothetical protein